MIHLPLDSRPTSLPFRLTACQKAKPLAEVGPNADCPACLAVGSAPVEEVAPKPSPATAVKPSALPRLGAPAQAPAPAPVSSLPRLGAPVSSPSLAPGSSVLPRLGGLTAVPTPPVREEETEEEDDEEGDDEEGGFDLEALLAQLEVLKGLETVPGGTGSLGRFEEKEGCFAQAPLHGRDRAVLRAVVGALIALDLVDVADHLVSIVEAGLSGQAEEGRHAKALIVEPAHGDVAPEGAVVGEVGDEKEGLPAQEVGVTPEGALAAPVISVSAPAVKSAVKAAGSRKRG